ncbi:MAG: response regulator [Deltaproteobacteria bacterium]|nr:response regulator [Deltaproteobacteria bacterium]
MDGNTILLVDDVDFTLEIEKKTLERTGCTVLTAKSGAEALEVIGKIRPNLILMDIYMPGMKGDECCKIIKENPQYKDIPIIFTTTAGWEEAKQKCDTSGCDGVITKPFKGYELFREIKRFIKLGEREQIRVSCSSEITFIIAGREHKGKIHDISSGGLFIESKYLPQKGNRAELIFLLPGRERKIKARAEVVRVVERGSLLNSEEGRGFGIHFLDLSEDAQAAVNEYVYGL